MTPAAILGSARDSLQLAQQYSRLAETQRTVRVPGHDEELSTEAVAIHHMLRARAEIDRAIQEMRR